MASPERLVYAVSLLDKVSDMGFSHTSLIIDHSKNEWDNGEICLRAYSGDYHVILQDDAIIGENFYTNIINAISLKQNSLISLYTGTSRPFPTRIVRAVNEADSIGASFLQAKSLFWGVGFIIPTRDILPMLDYVKDSKLPFDQRIGLYFKQLNKPVYYTYPSIVDHNDELDSLIGYSIKSVRKAHKYSDELINFNDITIICDNI